MYSLFTSTWELFDVVSALTSDEATGLDGVPVKVEVLITGS